MGAANPLQGEIHFETEDGKDYLAVFDIPAICAMEDLLDRPAVQIVGQVYQGRVGFIRAALWAGLRSKHPKLTLNDVGALMMTIKDRKAFEIVIEGVKAAFPASLGDAADGASEGDGEDADPPTAPGEGGTGKAS